MFDLYDDQGRYLRTVRSGRNLKAPNGTTVTDATAVPVPVLNAAGVYPVRDPGKPDQAWQQVMGATREIVDGYSVWSYQVAPLPAEERAARLQARGDAAMDAIDQAAEEARKAFITAGSGQAMVYQVKEKEAEAAQAVIDAGGELVTADYPHLAAEVGVTAGDLAGVAATVLAKAAAWRQVSAAIEGQRLAAKAAVAAAVAADDPEAVEAAKVIAWPTPETVGGV